MVKKPIDGEFPSTHWSLVSVATGKTSASDEALRKICKGYWGPVFTFTRRQYGLNHHDAEDLTQSFFAWFFAKDHLHSSCANKGKLRTFILTYLQNFARNEWRKQRAQKRHAVTVPIDTLENAFSASSATHYDRIWAQAILENAQTELLAFYRKRKKETLFSMIRHRLSDPDGHESYQELSDRLGITTSQLKVEIHRMKKRYGNILHQIVTNTVANPDQVADEIRYLFKAAQ